VDSVNGSPRRTRRVSARVLGRLHPGTISVFIDSDDASPRLGARIAVVDEDLVPVDIRSPGNTMELFVLQSADGEKIVGVVAP
jgi:hypothetical protein